MKEGKTLGQRIQEGRKAAGLSQEALGEELHVSRQAVSKWEADAATPELENLIAMSRLFGRTVGELLGVEEAVSGQAAGSAPPELTEKELAAAEAIAAKYMEAVRRESRPRWTLRQRAAALALLFLVGAAGVFLCGQLRSTGRQLTLLQQQVNGIQNDLSWEIASLAGRISDILDEKSNILIDSSLSITAFDAKASTVTLCARASAREWTNATTAMFSATLSDGRQFTAEAIGSDGSFTADHWTVPMDEEITVCVALFDGSSARTGQVDTLYDCLPGNFLLHVTGCMGASWSSTSDRVSLQDLDLTIEAGSVSAREAGLAPAAADLCLYRNQEILPEQVLPVEQVAEIFQQAGCVALGHWSPCNTSFTLSPGDTVAAVVRVTDNNGQTTYTVISAFGAGKNGSVRELDPHGNWNDYLWKPGNTIPNP